MHLRSSAPVLLIDDDPLFAQEVQDIVEGGRRFLWLHSSEGAIETIRSETPSVILVDLHMSRRLSQLDEEEGLEIIRHLSSSERSKVIVVTGQVSHTMRQRLGRLGVSRIYLKSQPASRLVGLIAARRES